MAWYRDNKKKTTDDALNIRIKDLAANNFFLKTQEGDISWNGKWKGSSAGIKYDKEESYMLIGYLYKYKEEIRTRIPILVTQPNFGGIRYWFKCPNCGKKVTTLYLKKYFYCRDCNDLCYASQQKDFMHRMMDMAEKYRCKAVDVNDDKRKGIHRSTFDKLMRKAEYYDNMSLLSVCKKLKVIRNPFFRKLIH